MKKILVVIGILLAIIIGAIIVLPIVFKDDIKALVEAEIDDAVDAEVFFDEDMFSLSLLSNFPNFSVTVGDFGVMNRAPFEGEILFAAHKFKLVVDLSSVVFGPQPKINAILLDGVKINVKVLEDGTANYDIAKEAEPTTDEETNDLETESGETKFSIAIDRWEIRNMDLVYDDQSTNTILKIVELNHTGSGDFTQDVFDLATNTEIRSIDASYDGNSYLSDKQLGVDLILNMNLPESKYSFKDNEIRLNDFQFGFDGDILISDDYKLDLTFASKENTFKSILSLVPGMYTESYEDLKTKGNLQFGGSVNGTYNDSTGQLPAFDLSLKIKDAMFSYPDLPTAVENILVDLSVENKNGIIEDTRINLKDFHIDFGTNPVDARLIVENLRNYPIDADLEAKLNLAELSSMFPMEGLELKGQIQVDAKAKGVYDSIQNLIPKVDLSASLADGFAKYEEYPVPLEDIHFNVGLSNQTGKLNDTEFILNDFTVLMAKEKLNANMRVDNLEDPAWEVHVHGGLDLGELLHIFPQEGLAVAGKIMADIDSEGRLSDVEAERYNRLPTKGSMVVTGLSVTDEANLPMGMKIDDASMIFNPDKISLEKMVGFVGQSDIQLNGFVSNYLGFVMDDEEVLKGQLNFNSSRFDVNEWMVSTEEDTTMQVETDTTSLSPVEVPGNIDFVFASNIKEVIYDNLTLNNVNGDIIVRDGQVVLDDLNFGLLNGRFVMNGAYDPRDLSRPLFDFDFAIKELSIPQAYQAFNTIQAAAPVAKTMEGKFSTQFKLSGALTQEMMPDYSSLQGKGLVEIAEAVIKGSKALNAVNKVTSLGFSKGGQTSSGKGDYDIKDLLMQAEIVDGRVNIKPTNLSIGGYKSVLSGSTGLTGDLDLIMDMEVPAGAAGQAFNQAVSSFLGSGDPASSKINLKLGITGTQDDPKVKILGTSTGTGTETKEAVKEAIADKALDQLGISGEEGETAEETLKREAEEAKKKAEEEARKKAEEEAEKAKKALEEKLKKEKEEAKKKLKKLFGGG
jgi:hypothetical protein